MSPQITAITINSPTIVRTMLAPPELVCELPAVEEKIERGRFPAALGGRREGLRRAGVSKQGKADRGHAQRGKGDP